jgi:hypothetical protein
MNNKPTHINGSCIVAALISNLTHTGRYPEVKITRVWCEDGSLHLVTGYDSACKFPCFDTVVGYWEIPEGSSYLSKDVKEVITRPSFLKN